MWAYVSSVICSLSPFFFLFAGLKRGRPTPGFSTRKLGNTEPWEHGNLGTQKLGNWGTWELGNLRTWELGNLGNWETLGTKKITQPLGTKKSPNLFGQKKITQPLGTKKITQPLRTKKITWPSTFLTIYTFYRLFSPNKYWTKPIWTVSLQGWA